MVQAFRPIAFVRHAGFGRITLTRVAQPCLPVQSLRGGIRGAWDGVIPLAGGFGVATIAAFTPHHFTNLTGPDEISHFLVLGVRAALGTDLEDFAGLFDG